MEESLSQLRSRGAPRRASPRVRVVIALACLSCAHAPPSISGEPPVAPAPGKEWKAPHGTIPPEPAAPAASTSIPADLAPRASQLTLADVVDVALLHNPQTTLSWSQARTAAFEYGSARGVYFPTVDVTASVGRSQSTTQTGFVERTQFAPLVSLSYLLLDFGGRSGSIGAARENVIAVDLGYNATLQNVVLQAESAYFAYTSAKALAGAQVQTVTEEEQNLQAAQVRHRDGVATVADVLQAQTLLAQAQLDLETDSGTVKTNHGNLAAAMGLRADADFEIAMPSDTLAIGNAADSVDTLIVGALANRPDMAAARVSVLQAQQQVRVARSEEFPALTLGANLGRNYSNLSLFAGNNYAITLGITIPIFNGFSYQYNVAAAKSRVDESAASADLLRTQVSNQVVTSYTALRTATARVRSADALLASAQQSEQVARGRYRAGVGTILDLLTAQSALASARAQQAQTRWTWATALAQLSHDVGVLGPHGETPIPLTHDSTGGHE